MEMKQQVLQLIRPQLSLVHSLEYDHLERFTTPLERFQKAPPVGDMGTDTFTEQNGLQLIYFVSRP